MIGGGGENGGDISTAHQRENAMPFDIHKSIKNRVREIEKLGVRALNCLASPSLPELATHPVSVAA